MSHEGAVSSRQAWIGSIAGWVFLLTAAGLFAAVMLAPKILTWISLQHDYADRQLRLLMIEDAVERAEKIAWTLEHEPEYARSLARKSFETHLTAPENAIPMPPELSLKPEVELVDQLTPPSAPYPWYTETLIQLTTNRGLTSLLLLVASLMTVLSFITTGGNPIRESTGNLWKAINKRYSRSPASSPTDGIVPRPKFATHENRPRTVRRTPFSGPHHTPSLRDEGVDE